MQESWAYGAEEMVGRNNNSARTTNIAWTPRNTPEMNSLSKRSNKTVKEMSRALLLDSGLSSVFWYKAVKHAVYFISIAYEDIEGLYLNGDSPSASALKIWDCKAWAIVPKEQ